MPRPQGRKISEVAKRSEFQDRVLEIRRVTRVIAGGKRFSFRATVAVGDLRGRVGIGIGKGLDVADAIRKGKRYGEKNIIRIPLIEGRTIPFDVEAKFSAARVRLKPARPNHGLIAGGASRAVLELAGVKDVSAKILGRTKNVLANAQATIAALKKLSKIPLRSEHAPASRQEGEKVKREVTKA